MPRIERILHQNDVRVSDRWNPALQRRLAEEHASRRPPKPLHPPAGTEPHSGEWQFLPDSPYNEWEGQWCWWPISALKLISIAQREQSDVVAQLLAAAQQETEHQALMQQYHELSEALRQRADELDRLGIEPNELEQAQFRGQGLRSLERAMRAHAYLFVLRGLTERRPAGGEPR